MTRAKHTLQAVEKVANAMKMEPYLAQLAPVLDVIARPILLRMHKAVVHHELNAYVSFLKLNGLFAAR